MFKYGLFSSIKSKVSSPTLTNNPFLSSPPASQQTMNIVDLFGTADTQPVSNAHSTKASDDLLQLGNPFADMFGGAPAAPVAAPTQNTNNMWMNNGKLT
jgi:phosphatidylinositol-binding clathrin assembly protein